MTTVWAVLWVVGLLFWVLCALEAITTPPERVRNLPKPAWVLITILLTWIGGIMWVVAGRPRRAPQAPRAPRGTTPAEYDRPGRAAASNPDDDAEFLQQLKRRAEEQRRRAAEEGGEATQT